MSSVAAHGGDPLSDATGLVILTDQVGEWGGTERVVEALIERFPAARVAAPRFETTNLPDRDLFPWAERTKVLGSFGRRNQFMAPLYARRLRARTISAAAALSVTHYGWVLAASIPSGTRHVCYYNGPPRALYGGTNLYLAGNPAPIRPLLRAAVPALRAHHRQLLRIPDRLLTNSAFSAERTRRHLGRTAEVVYPPVKTRFFTPAPRAREHFLGVARLVPPKRIDVAIDAFRGLGERLVVVGGGRGLSRLRAAAPPNVTFTGWVDDHQLRELYRSSKGLICPSVEDFGIVMAEAQATGTPVIALAEGAAPEVVHDGVTGVLLSGDGADAIAEAVRTVAAVDIDPAACVASAERFSVDRFLEGIERVFEEEAGTRLSDQRPAAVAPALAASV